MNLKRILFAALTLLVVVVAGALTYVKTALPNVGPPPNIKAPTDSASIAHGRYLANHVAVCMDCHSTRDWTKFSGPLAEGTLGRGGEVFDQRYGFPGSYVSRNITPFGIGHWTDGEVYRAITTGVNKDGKPLFPIMPYPYYASMDSADVLCIIAYLRTLPSAEHTPAASASDFPMNFIVHLIPQKAAPQQRPAPTDVLAYGKYLTTISGCAECHTPAENGQIIKGKEFTGGRDFLLPTGGTVYSANLTPHPTSGIGDWSRERFVQRFYAYRNAQPGVGQNEFNTAMPWTMYAGMTEQDLGAIYAYLKTLPPSPNSVERFKAATPQ
jgi:mono/diheme cytochrome c family protein